LVIRLLTLAFLTMATLPWAATAAAEPVVTVTLGATPAEVRVGEATRLEFRVHARGGSIQNLDLGDLKKYPELEIVSHQTIRPMQFSFGFGSGVQKESSLANVYILHPMVAGTYEFAPAVAKVDGKTYRSASLTLVVHPISGGATGSSGPAAASDATIESDLSGARYDEHAFLRTVVEPQEVYIGQQVNVTVYLYMRLRLSPQSVVPSKPSMDGFWVHDDPVTSLQSQTVSVKGTHYRAFVLQRSAAFPQRAGELTIGPPKVTFDAGGGSLFDARRRLERVGVPITVTVKPLPQPGPANAVLGPRRPHYRKDGRCGDVARRCGGDWQRPRSSRRPAADRGRASAATRDPRSATVPKRHIVRYAVVGVDRDRRDSWRAHGADDRAPLLRPRHRRVQFR
jgi:hypothetical protein